MCAGEAEETLLTEYIGRGMGNKQITPPSTCAENKAPEREADPAVRQPPPQNKTPEAARYASKDLRRTHPICPRIGRGEIPALRIRGGPIGGRFQAPEPEGRSYRWAGAHITHLPSPLQCVFKGIVDSPTSASSSSGRARSRRGHRGIIRHSRSAAASCPTRSLPRKKENGGGREPFTFLRGIVLGGGGAWKERKPRETSRREGWDFVEAHVEEEEIS